MKIKYSINKTKLIATMGPTFEKESFVKKMFLNGVTTVRLNTSHGDFAEHAQRIKTVKKLRKELDLPVSIMLDTKGPEIRVHTIKDKKFYVKYGDKIDIHSKKEILGEKGKFSMTYKQLPTSVTIGQEIMVDDGKLTLEVKKINKTTGIVTVVAKNNHFIGTKKAINIPGADLKLNFLEPHDKDFIKWGVKQGIDLVAASFVTKKEDLILLRKFLDNNGGKDIKIMSKVEALKSIENLTDIVTYSDQIMIARGDLGVEIPFEKVPFYTQLIIDKTRAQAKSVVVATQMLDSMMENPKPTRAEVTDIYFSALAGADSTMLSGESASGDFPLESVQTMFKVVKEAENNFNFNSAYTKALGTSVSKNAESAYEVAKNVLHSDVKYIIAFSTQGRLVNSLSSFRPRVPIFAMLKDSKLVNKYGVTYGVYAQHHTSQSDFNSNEKVKEIAKKIGLKKGEKVLVANKNNFRTIRI